MPVRQRECLTSFKLCVLVYLQFQQLLDDDMYFYITKHLATLFTMINLMIDDIYIIKSMIMLN